MDECLQKVKKYDKDRFLSTLLMPKNIQRKLLPIYSFNIEISKIQNISPEPMVRMIRLQWWYDEIKDLYDNIEKKQSNIILNELRLTILEQHIPERLLIQYLECHREYIEKNIHESIIDIENAAYNKTGSMLKIILIAINYYKRNTEEIIKHASIGLYITNILKNESFCIQKKITYLPQNLLNESGINAYNIMEDKHTQVVQEIVKLLVEKAESHIDQVRNLLSSQHNSMKSILLPITSADCYLKRIRKHKFNIYKHDVGYMHFPIQMKMIINSLIRRV